MLKNFDTQNMCLMRKQNVRKLSFTHLKYLKNDRNGGAWQSGISKSLAEYDQHSASSMYSRLCMIMSSFLFVRVWAIPRTLYISCGIPFPVWTPDIISGLTSFLVWLSR